ncbi:hypothetical protein AVEN_172658-1 [Araneus ventricosus]|uniref:Reverse transcriptase/retrotransposon-derived protein RNase H-like domain-containing protein n=1 Tax=Araneus ventricosus TaxID=182803 RepID=A0A4Y2HKC8_ARAVE|nr:hypothetical protein AVEN_172658-1 [Araneus ventricosus]
MYLEGVGKLQAAVDSTAGSAADELKDCRNYRLLVTDKQTGLLFLADSGADLSIIPATLNHKICNSFKLYAANGTVIPTFGFKILTLDLGPGRSFQFPFVIAKVDRAILGADFLTNFQLIIDMHNKKLMYGVTNLSIRSHIACVTSADSITIFTDASDYAVGSVLQQFEEDSWKPLAFFSRKVRKSLEPSYDGPIPVVKRHDMYFAVTIKGKDINISVDRLEPAYFLLTEVDAPHHKKLDTVPTLPNENLTAHQETER